MIMMDLVIVSLTNKWQNILAVVVGLISKEWVSTGDDGMGWDGMATLLKEGGDVGVIGEPPVIRIALIRRVNSNPVGTVNPTDLGKSEFRKTQICCCDSLCSTRQKPRHQDYDKSC